MAVDCSFTTEDEKQQIRGKINAYAKSVVGFKIKNHQKIRKMHQMKKKTTNTKQKIKKSSNDKIIYQMKKTNKKILQMKKKKI